MQLVYFLKAVEFWSPFWHSKWHNLSYISGKVAKPHILESPQKSKRAVEHAIFYVLPVPFFQISIDYCQKSYNGVQKFLGSSKTTQTFLIFTFWQRNSALLNFFEIWTEMHFVSLCFLNERNITTSLLMIHLKCTVAHYSNLNSSSVSKPFLNYGQLNMLFLFFFDFLFTFIFTRILSKKYEATIIFLIKISEIHFKM